MPSRSPFAVGARYSSCIQGDDWRETSGRQGCKLFVLLSMKLRDEDRCYQFFTACNELRHFYTWPHVPNTVLHTTGIITLVLKMRDLMRICGYILTENTLPRGDRPWVGTEDRLQRREGYPLWFFSAPPYSFLQLSFLSISVIPF